MNLIDISFYVFSDTPKGKDPDTYSPTLRKYHQILWGKRLPSGVNFDLDDNFPRKLHHKSELGEFFLSSDAIDLTLECIRRFYLKENSPLSDTLRRYFQFLDLFEDFKGYVDFFLLQDLVEQNYSAIKYWHPFNGFDNPPLPSNFDEYQSYKTKVIDFVNARNKRILSLT